MNKIQKQINAELRLQNVELGETAQNDNSTFINLHSTLGKLIQQYCPDGVEYVKLDDMGNFYSGLSGKSKEDFRDGNAKFITYVNIFNNPALNTDVEDKVKIADGEKQNTI